MFAQEHCSCTIPTRIQGDLDIQKSQTMALLSTDTVDVQKSRENQQLALRISFQLLDLLWKP